MQPRTFPGLATGTEAKAKAPVPRPGAWSVTVETCGGLALNWCGFRRVVMWFFGQAWFASRMAAAAWPEFDPFAQTFSSQLGLRRLEFYDRPPGTPLCCWLYSCTGLACLWLSRLGMTRDLSRHHLSWHESFVAMPGMFDFRVPQAASNARAVPT